MARSPSEEPQGLVYRRDLLSAAEERELLAHLERSRFDLIVMHGQPAKRTARHFGLDYDYESRTPLPGERLRDGSSRFEHGRRSAPGYGLASSSRSSCNAHSVTFRTLR